jgi:hypothetical protein
MLRPPVAAALLIVALAFPLAAQESEIQPGARVRVQMPGLVAGKFAGTVITRTADTLVLGGPNIVPIRIPFVPHFRSIRGTSSVLFSAFIRVEAVDLPLLASARS